MMKTYCKNIKLNIETVMPWVFNCVGRHRKRHDFLKLLKEHGYTDDDSYAYAIRNITEDAINRIKNRELNLEPPQIREKLDTTTGKIRLIGKESAMQQVLDYIAVYGCMDIFKARMVSEQASSIPNRGQVYGKEMIQRWIRKDLDAKRYADRHGYHYSQQFVYFCKLDIKKCYPTADTDKFLELFRKDCGNKDLMWLWEQLIYSHRIEDYKGFLIGALPSQWASQYMISYIYRFARLQGRARRGEHISAVKHMLMFMDDMLLVGSNRNQLKKAIERMISYTKNELGWEIKPNWHIREFSKFDIDMMGYVIHHDGSCTIRSRDFVRMRRLWLRCHDNMTIQQATRIMSYKGFCDHTSNRKIISKYQVRPIWNKARKMISERDRKNGNG